MDRRTHLAPRAKSLSVNLPPRQRSDALSPVIVDVARGTGTLMRPNPGLRSPVGRPGQGTIIYVDSSDSVQGSPGPRPSHGELAQETSVGPYVAHQAPGSQSVGEDETAFGRRPREAYNDPWMPVEHQEAVESSHTQERERVSERVSARV